MNLWSGRRDCRAFCAKPGQEQERCRGKFDCGGSASLPSIGTRTSYGMCMQLEDARPSKHAARTLITTSRVGP